MKVDKIRRIICSVLLIVIIFGNVFNIVEASSAINLYNGTVSDEEAGGGITETRKIIGRIITVAQVIGMFLAVAMSMILGIKYIIASPEDKAQIKNHLTVYVIGVIVLFGSSGILEIIKNFFIKSITTK